MKCDEILTPKMNVVHQGHPHHKDEYSKIKNLSGNTKCTYPPLERFRGTSLIALNANYPPLEGFRGKKGVKIRVRRNR